MQAQQTKEMETGIQASLEGLLETLRGKIHETQQQSVEETQKQLSAARESAVTCWRVKPRRSPRPTGSNCGRRSSRCKAADEGDRDGDSGQFGRPTRCTSRKDSRRPKTERGGDREAVGRGKGISLDRAGERSLGEVGILPGAIAGGAAGDACATDKGNGNGNSSQFARPA